MTIGRQGLVGGAPGGGRPRIRPQADDSWKAQGTCRQVLADYMAAGWDFERAQRHVTDLYYVPNNGTTLGRPPKRGGSRPKKVTADDDPYCLPRMWCAGCPVRERCLEEAVDGGDAFGFRAGFMPQELRALIKARRRSLRHLRELAAVPG